MGSTVEIAEAGQKALGELAEDARVRAADLSHEAQRLKVVAEDVIEDGVHAAKRALKSAKRRAEEIGDLKDEAAHRVKRQPLRAVGVALCVGFAVGMVLGWVAHGAAEAKS